MVKVFCDKEFLNLFFETNSTEFDLDEVDLEKRLFVTKILKLNLCIESDDNFISYLNKVKSNIFQIEEIINDNLLFRIINYQKNNQNYISSDNGLLKKIRQHNDLTNELNSHDIILISNVDQNFCESVSIKYGVLCIGISNLGKLLVSSEYIKENLSSTDNLFNELCNILSRTPVSNKLSILIDQYFFSNDKIQFRLLYSSLKNKHDGFLKVYFCENPRNGRGKTVDQININIDKNCKSLSSKISLLPVNRCSDIHDRYLIIGPKIFVAGNSFATTKNSTILSFYPFSLYFENLPINIKGLIHSLTSIGTESCAT